MTLRPCLLLLVIAAGNGLAADYHVHPQRGDDRNPGTSQEAPWRSLGKVSSARLKPGDRVLLAAGQEFLEPLSLTKLRGAADAPITIASYADREGPDRAIIRIRDATAAVQIINSSHVVVRDLELTTAPPGVAAKRNRGMRVGLLVLMTRRGDYENIRLSNLAIHDVYFERPGVTRSAEETRTANGTQSYGYGIRVLARTAKATLTGLVITDSSIERVSHTGIKIGAEKPLGFRDIRIAGNRLADTGGPGMQMSRVRDMVVRNNVVNGSGSTSDTRNWGRGSGMWTWKSEDVLIEKNAFLNANGPADSAGVHIDFGCRNVIIQYNLSANNAGGFYEVLGDNHNTAYRYNVSLNDGYRVKGQNGAFQEGKTYWLSGYVGQNKEETGPFNSYFYNNTIFVDENIVARMALSRTAEGVLIANNIFYIRGRSEALTGKKYQRDRSGDDAGQVVFANNLFLSPDNWPDATGISDSAPIIGDPGFEFTDAMKIGDFRPTNAALVADRGIPVELLPGDSVGLPGGLAVGHDILGQRIDGLPDVGAIEISGELANE